MEPPLQIDRPLTGVLFRRKDRACPRSAHLPRRAFAKPEKLFLVMPSMHQMKLSPLCRSHRTQNRMVEQLYLAPEAGFTLRDDHIHRRKLCPNLVSHLLRRQAPRLGHCGGFSSGVAERWVGSCRRDLLDHVIVLNERHLKRLMTEYVRYYQEDRTHLGLAKDMPTGRPVAIRTTVGNRVHSFPRLGGLHHRYAAA